MQRSDKVISSKNSRVLAVAFFAILAWFSLFLQLDTLSIRMYDESRNAVSAMNMLENGEILVRYWAGEPDTWETKPPLLVWLQAGSMKLFGYNELAVRLPSALAALFTATFLWFFCARRGQFTAGFWTAIILLASPGYVDIHTARTGDHDTLVILFMMLYSLLVFDLVENEKRPKRHMLWLGLLISLAVLTKSIAGFFALPGLAVYIIYKKKPGFFLGSKWFYGAVAIVLVLIGGYYTLREYFYPGQLEAVWEMELWPRYTNSTDRYEYNQEPFWFYAENLVQKRWIPYIWLLPILVFFGWKSRKSRPLVIFSAIQLLSLFFILSAGTTNVWYDAPMYPYLALLAGTGVVGISDFIRQKSSAKLSMVPYAVMLVLTGFGAGNIIQENLTRHRDTPWPAERIGYLMRQGKKMRIIPKDYRIVTEGYHSHAEFYAKSFRMGDLGNVYVSSSSHSFKDGEVLLACTPSVIEKLKKRYPSHRILHESMGCLFMRIEKKPD